MSWPTDIMYLLLALPNMMEVIIAASIQTLSSTSSFQSLLGTDTFMPLCTNNGPTRAAAAETAE